MSLFRQVAGEVAGIVEEAEDFDGSGCVEAVDEKVAGLEDRAGGRAGAFAAEVKVVGAQAGRELGAIE